MRFGPLVVFALGCASELPPDDRCVTEMTANGESVAQSIEEVDSEGRLVSIRTEHARARPPFMRTDLAFEYDAEGRLVTVESVESGDAWLELSHEDGRILARYGDGRSIEFTLEEGRVVSERQSIGDDRSVHTVQYSYDERGRLFERAERSIENGTQVTYQRTMRVLAFDDSDRPLEGEHGEVRGDAPLALGDRYTWSYAEDAGALVVTRDVNGVSMVGRYQTDAMGRLLGQSIDEDADGAFDWLSTYAYDDDARTMNALVLSSRAGLAGRREWGFVARGRCPAPRLSEHGIRAAEPLPVGEGRIDLDVDGIDLLGF